MTVLVSSGRLIPAKSFPLPAGRARTAGPSAGSIPLLRADGSTATYEAMIRSQPWVYAVVTKLVYAGSRLPFNSYTRGDGNTRERDRETELARLLRRPRPGVAPFTYKAAVWWDLLVHGRALVLKARERGPGSTVTELWNVPWPSVRRTIDDSGLIQIDVMVGGRALPIPLSECVLYELPGGVSPLEPLRRTLALEDAAMTWQGESFANGVTPRGAFQTDAKLDDKTFPRLREELTNLYSGPENAGRFGLFDQGLKWIAMGQSAVDAEVVAQRRLSREEVAAAYDVPPPAVGILDRATFSNVTELRKALYVEGLGPKATLVEESTQAQLVDPEPRWDGLFVEHDLNEILRPDPQARMAAYLLGQQSSTYTINERRAAENLPPIEDPIGDTILVPVNMRPSSAYGEDGVPLDDSVPPATDPVTASAVNAAIALATATVPPAAPAEESPA